MWGRQQYYPLGVKKTTILSHLDTDSKILERIWKRATVKLWLSGLHTGKLHGTIISQWESFLVFRNLPHLNSAHKTSFPLAAYYIIFFCDVTHCAVSRCVWRSYTSLFNRWFSLSFSNFPRFFSRPSLCL